MHQKNIRRLFLGISLLMAAVSTSVFADREASCPNQQLACNIASVSSQLVGDADAAWHWDLRWAAYNQYLIAYDFCRCDYSIYTPGSGVLVSAYAQVKYAFGAMGGAPAASQPEKNRMLQLRKLFGN
jgi:hypothetical protein